MTVIITTITTTAHAEITITLPRLIKPACSVWEPLLELELLGVVLLLVLLLVPLFVLLLLLVPLFVLLLVLELFWESSACLYYFSYTQLFAREK